MNKLSKKNLLLVGLMLFSMFFGAGNLIFPPLLGQKSGTNLIISLLGFLISAVGLPILAVATVAKSGGLQTLASRVHKSFAFIFTLSIYIIIAFIGAPRAGSIAFEMSVSPFLPQSLNGSFLPPLIYTFCFFLLVFLLSLNPTKLVDHFGKILTPTTILLIISIFVASLVKPIAGFSAPIGDYATMPLLKGFLDGYMTMDTIGALNFGIVIALVLKEKGVTTEKDLVSYTIKAGILAGSFLTIIYAILAYLGACSQTRFGATETGAQTLSNIVFYLFNSNGLIILGLIFTLACLATSVGLITSCGNYFNSLIPKIGYKSWVAILCVFGCTLANIGLTKILQVSVPILTVIYPLSIVLICLAFAHNLFKGYNSVYFSSILFTAIFSISDALNQIGLNIYFLKYIPFSSNGLAWVIPSIIGAIVGFVYHSYIKKDIQIA